MKFQTKIIEGNKNPKARIAWAGGALVFLAMILMCMDKYQRYGFWMFGVAVVVLVVGALLSRGDVGAINISETELFISPVDIRVGETLYPLAQVSDIVFQVEGYAGMLDPEGYARNSSRSQTSGFLNGMNNYLNFTFGNEKQEWQFYLPDPQRVQELGAMFKEFYANGVPFVERSLTSDRTFLFAPVTEKRWKDLMIENGYQIG